MFFYKCLLYRHKPRRARGKNGVCPVPSCFSFSPLRYDGKPLPCGSGMAVTEARGQGVFQVRKGVKGN